MKNLVEVPVKSDKTTSQNAQNFAVALSGNLLGRACVNKTQDTTPNAEPIINEQAEEGVEPIPAPAASEGATPTMQNGSSGAALAAPQTVNAVVSAAKPKRDFDGLVKRYHRQAYNIAYRLTGNHADAEDLTQEAFVRAFRFFDNYRRDLPFENWLFRIISNLFVDELRRKPKARIHSLDAPVGGENGDNNAFFEIPDSRENPERVVLHEELDETIQRALDSLPPDFRMTVVLADIENLSYEEISETMKCSLGTVRSRLHRGRKQLRTKLAGFGLK